MMFASLVNTVLLSVIVGGVPDTWRLVQNLHGKIVDATFVYEGETVSPDISDYGNLAKNKVTPFSGKGSFHSRGISSWEYINASTEREQIVKHSIHCDGEHREQLFIRTIAQPIHQSVSPNNFLQIRTPRSFGRIWPIPMLAACPESVFADAEDLGESKLNGHTCRGIRISLAGVMQFEYTFDLERSGQVVDMKEYVKGNLSLRVHSYRFAEVRDNTNQIHWIPIECQMDTFIQGSPMKNNKVPKFTYHKEPTLKTATYRILSSTIKLNTGVDPDTLEIRFDPREEVVTPRDLQSMPKAAKEIADMRKPVAIADVKQAIEAAKGQEDTLKRARLPAPSGSYLWWPGTYAIIGSLGLMAAVVWWRYRT